MSGNPTLNWFIVKGFVVRNLARLQVLAHVEHKNQHPEYNYYSLLPISEHISSNTLNIQLVDWPSYSIAISGDISNIAILFTVLIVDENFSIAQHNTWRMERDFVTLIKQASHAHLKFISDELNYKIEMIRNDVNYHAKRENE
jgi:hypothetical protein